MIPLLQMLLPFAISRKFYLEANGERNFDKRFNFSLKKELVTWFSIKVMTAKVRRGGLISYLPFYSKKINVDKKPFFIEFCS